MEVIVFSSNINKSRKIQSATDKIIMNKRLRLMSIHTVLPRNQKELCGCFKKDKAYLVIIDISETPNWEKIITSISSNYHHVKFCVISDSNDAAPKLINMMVNICGYINVLNDDILAYVTELFVCLYSKVKTLAGGVLVTANTGELKVIDYNSIFYIETIKQQHKCCIVHQYGVDTIRADISKLINNLDSRFEITRSSTIANLSNVISISNGMVIFNDDTSCLITPQKLPTIKRLMKETAII